MNGPTRTIEFNGTPIESIVRDGRLWITSEQIGIALGLHRPRMTVARIYGRHSDEFTADMQGVVNLSTRGGLQQTRIFSARGAWLVGLFCRSDRARDFRRWVLNVLESAQPEVQS